jgi:hypothetical protein
MDTAFAFKGPIVGQAEETYHNVWNEIELIEKAGKGLNTVESVDTASSEATAETSSKSPESVKPLPLTPTENAEYKRLVDWIDQPSFNYSDQPQPAETVYQARILHHDFLKQMRRIVDFFGDTPSNYSNDFRSDYLGDPILHEVIKLLEAPDTKNFFFYTLAMNFHPKLKAAISQAVKRGVSIRAFTNSRESHRSVVPIKFPVGWYAGLGDLDDLLQNGLQAFGLVPQPFDGVNGGPHFIHRKLAVLDDIVMLGSHNFNMSSTVESDEVNIEIQGKQISQEVRALFKLDLKKYGDWMNPTEIKEERENSRFYQWLCGHLGGLY